MPNFKKIQDLNPLNAELNPICHLLSLLGGATIVVVSRLRVNLPGTPWATLACCGRPLLYFYLLLLNVCLSAIDYYYHCYIYCDYYRYRLYGGCPFYRVTEVGSCHRTSVVEEVKLTVCHGNISKWSGTRQNGHCEPVCLNDVTFMTYEKKLSSVFWSDAFLYAPIPSFFRMCTAFGTTYSLLSSSPYKVGRYVYILFW